LTSFEKKFFRQTAGYTLFDHERCAEILEELKAQPVDEENEEETKQIGYDM
jgi:hypothetical protein